jgi:hypothetical protein
MTDRSYFGRVALAWDRFINTTFGGDPDHSVSASIGQQAAAGRAWARAAETIVDWLFVVLRSAPWGHCRRQAQREGLIV